jgi:predicted RNase H-like nuclease (RuvC/YqgF family)
MLRRFFPVLLLLSLLSYCVQTAPALEITEEELNQLETILIQSKEELRKSKAEVERLESISIELKTELTTLSTSFEEYASEAEKIQEDLRKDLEKKRIAINIGLGIIAAESLVIAVLVFLK